MGPSSGWCFPASLQAANRAVRPVCPSGIDQAQPLLHNMVFGESLVDTSAEREPPLIRVPCVSPSARLLLAQSNAFVSVLQTLT
eukprot:2906181-Amphidinium_carterae.1